MKTILQIVFAFLPSLAMADYISCTGPGIGNLLSTSAYNDVKINSAKIMPDIKASYRFSDEVQVYLYETYGKTSAINMAKMKRVGGDIRMVIELTIPGDHVVKIDTLVGDSAVEFNIGDKAFYCRTKLGDYNFVD